MSLLPTMVIFVALTMITTAKIHAEVDCSTPPPDYTPEDVRTPMRFFRPEAAACFGNAANWPYLAVGEITKDTPKAFTKFAGKNPPDAPIQFVSPGGDIVSALKLGERIREGGYDTSLGEICASACAYAILGGVHRYTVRQEDWNSDSDYDNRNVGAAGTKLGVHQFYRSASFGELQKKAFSAIELSIDQAITALILEYTFRMGVDTRIVSAASKIPPWEEMYWLSPKEMLDWNIDNTKRQYTEILFHAFGRSGSYVEVTNRRGKDASHLRIFCRDGIKEPIFSFIVERSLAITTQSLPNADQIKKHSIESIRDLLSRLDFSYGIGSEGTSSSFQIDGIHADLKTDSTVRIFAAIRTDQVTRELVEKLTHVKLVDNGDLARAEWTVQDFLKFRIVGDRRLIRLAMKNCVS